MSSYLRFYIVPKNGKPLHFLSFHRVTTIYQSYNTILCPPVSNDSENPEYKEISIEDRDKVVKSIESNLKDLKKVLTARLKVIDNTSKFMNSDELNLCTDMQLKITDLEEELTYIKHIHDVFYELKFSEDFTDKVLINID